jgi:hypothetical protein
MDDTDEEME